MLAAIRLFFKMVSKLSEKLRETKSIYLLVNRYLASFDVIRSDAVFAKIKRWRSGNLSNARAFSKNAATIHKLRLK